jgi:regulator of sigma E protease
MLGLKEGEMSDELRAVLEDKSKWFVEKGYFARSAIVFAGPLFNFLYAMFVVTAAVLYYGESRLVPEPIVGVVTENSPAEKAGLLKDDRVVTINGVAIDSWQSLAENIHSSGGGVVKLEVERDSGLSTIEITPTAKLVPNPDGSKTERFMVGIGPSSETVKHGLLAASVMSVRWTWSRIELICSGLWGMIQGKGSADDLAGPQFILETAGKFAEQGFESLLYFSAFLSITLAVLNLLPIPVLDGGHLMFFTYEAIFGPISMRVKEISQTVAMLLLVSLMVFAIRNDIVRDPKSMNGEITWEEEQNEVSPDASLVGSGEEAIELPAQDVTDLPALD